MTPNLTHKERRERLLFDAKQMAFELDDLESTLIAVGGPVGSGEVVAYAAGHIRNLLEELAADRRRLEALRDACSACDLDRLADWLEQNPTNRAEEWNWHTDIRKLAALAPQGPGEEKTW
jgi:hypothetical protein